MATRGTVRLPVQVRKPLLEYGLRDTLSRDPRVMEMHCDVPPAYCAN
jgi:hypothetical protein